MKPIRIGFTITLLMMITACAAANDQNKTGQSQGTSNLTLNDFEVTSPTSEVNEGDFVYRLVSEQPEYAAGEEVRMYAELIYQGDQEEITIAHSASPFYFPMTEKTRSYDIHYAMNEPLLHTTLKAEVPLREDYRGSGGYSSTDPEEYKSFINDITNNHFPHGYYVVHGSAQFFVENETGDPTDYHIEAEIDFKVNK